MKCPDCRMESPDNAVFCQYCGYSWGLIRPVPSVRPRSRFVDVHFKTLLTALLIVLTVAGGIVGYAFAAKVPLLAITNADASYTANMDMEFVVDVMNRGIYTSSATIVCTVSYASDGSTYEDSTDITLAPGQSQTYDIVVLIVFYYPDETANWGCHLE